MTIVSKPEEAAPPGIGLFVLFVTFASIGLSGFGGVLPIARHVLVERRGWMTPAGFTDLLSLCQILPGPNIVNLTICFGTRARGVPGALAGLTGLLSMPVAIVLAIAGAYAEFSDVPAVANAISGIASGAAGLVVATALKMAHPMLVVPRAVVLAAVVFVLMVFVRVPLVWMIVLMAPIGVFWAWMRPHG